MTSHPVSPNTVLANTLHHPEGVLRPRIWAIPPERIVLVVGTQINGTPHIGTSLVESLAFAMAARLHDRFDLPTAGQPGETSSQATTVNSHVDHGSMRLRDWRVFEVSGGRRRRAPAGRLAASCLARAFGRPPRVAGGLLMANTPIKFEDPDWRECSRKRTRVVAPYNVQIPPS